MKKAKRRVKKKWITITIISVITIILILFLYNPVTSIISIKNKGYSLSISYKIYKKGIKEEVLNHDYSELLDNIIETDYYNDKYLSNYFEISYNEGNDYLKSITNLLNLGYNSKDINKIYEYNNDELLKKVSEKYISDIIKYLEFDYFKVDKLDRYLSYFNGNYSDTIIKVNIGLDKKYFENPNIVKTYSVDMIVNKYNKLERDFEPNNLVELTKCSDSGEYLSKEAKEAYDKLCDASKKAGLHLGVTSSYRSYDSQKKIYDSYLKSNGQEYVDKYVATPGFSEHQTGLALDVKSTLSSPFKTTKEYKWMIDNSYKYGFVLRYPEGLENITGYNAESWHFRYVGKEIAKYIHENNITYEEYCAIFL